MCQPAFDVIAVRNQWGSCHDRAYLAVLDVFVSEADLLCKKLNSARSPLLPTSLRAAAHTLSGAAANVGAARLAACAQAIEFNAFGATPEELAMLLHVLNAAWLDVKKALSTMDRDA